MKHLYLIFFLWLFSLSGFAQGEYNVWCFGDSNLIDFNSGSPVHSLSSIKSGWASSTICDKNGTLLFYAQDDTVWNAAHNVMLNGTNIKATNNAQCVHIMPFACSDSLYYLFTISDTVDQNGYILNHLYYSVINMNANGGLGAVTLKNILLDTNIATGLGMTRHGNNSDYWITYQLADSNIFYSRQISTSGIGNSTTSQLGLNKIGSANVGSLEFSSDGSYLINCSGWNNNIQGYSFNNNTGVLSNPFYFILPSGTPMGIPMYSQFSPNLSKLYISGFTWLIQYDFSSLNISTIVNSGVIIASTPLNSDFYDLAVTPNNKIYISRSGLPFLAELSHPNNAGIACGFTNQAILTNGHATNAGFPTMLPNLFVHRNVLTDSLLCQYDTINLYLSDTNYIDSLIWNFGDIASGVANTSSDIIPLHVYNTYGTYPIEVIIFSGCVNDTIHDTIRINPTPIANLGPDTILCEGDSMQLLFNDTSFNYLWSTGDSSMSIQILNSDTFSIAISSICGVDYDTIVIDSLIPALVHLPNDTLLCDGDSLLLDATIQSGSYTWTPLGIGADSTFWVSSSGTYSVTATNFCGTDSDTIIVDYTHAPYFDFGNDTALCAGDTLILFAGDTLSSVLWQNNDTTFYDTITASGVYSATTTNLCGTHSDTIETWFLLPPAADLGNDTVLCAGDTLALSDTTLFGSYLWQNGSTNDTIFASAAGQYTITVSNICGSDSDSVFVDFDTIPTVNLGNDTLICNGDSILLSALFSRSIYLWSTGSTDSAISANTENTYWATATNLCGSGSDSIFLDVDSILNVDLGPDTILCSGASYTLESNVLGDSYVWSTGSIIDSIFINSAGVYQLSVTNVCGVFDDTIQVFYDNSPITNLGPDSTYCLSSLVNLNAHWSRATYLWNTADTTPSITANFSGNYSVLVANLCGFDDDTVMISYDIPISFNLGVDTLLCVGDSILLSAPAHNATWVWNTNSTDSTLMVNHAGTYAVSATNQCGTHSSTIIVTEETVPVLQNPVPDTSFCEGASYEVTIEKSNSNTVLWLDGTTYYQSSFDTNGWYSYALQNICGTTADTFQLQIEYPAKASLGSDTVLCYAEKIVKSFDYPNHTYLWNNGSTDSIQTITRTGVYGVTIWTPAQCESYDEFEVSDCGAQLFIPNAFTPGSGDDLNNTFKIQGVGIKKFHIVIYDRWGVLVFQSVDIDYSWNGLINNELAEQGVYTYKIWYNTGESSQSIIRVGSVTLLR